MRSADLFPSRRARPAKGQVREGLRYIRENVRIRRALFLLVVVGTLAYNFNTVLPVLAKQDFHGDATTYAVMLVAMGLGSVVGALAAAYRRRPSLRLIVAAALATGATMLLAATERSLAFEVGLLVVLGLFSILYLSTTNSTCQLSSAPEMRGRVMGVYSVIFMGSTPVGALLVGFVDQVLGARWGLAVGGLPTLVAAAVLGIILVREHGARQMFPSRPISGTGPGPGVAAVLPGDAASVVPASGVDGHGAVEGRGER